VTCVWDQRACQALDQRGLSRTVVADDREHFPGVQVEVDPVQSDDPAERLDQTAS
jgi:hypothetical protein